MEKSSKEMSFSTGVTVQGSRRMEPKGKISEQQWKIAYLCLGSEVRIRQTGSIERQWTIEMEQ